MIATSASCWLAWPSNARRADADAAGNAALAAGAPTLAASVNAAGVVDGHCTVFAFSVRPSNSSAAAGLVDASFHTMRLSAMAIAATRTSHGAAGAASGALVADAAAAACVGWTPTRNRSIAPLASRSRCHSTPSRRTLSNASLCASGCTSARPTRAFLQASSGRPAALSTARSRADTQPLSVTLGEPLGGCVKASSTSADSAPPATRTGSESGR